jgi:hypothetical protein
VKHQLTITPEPQGDLLTYSIQNEYEWGRVIIDQSRNMIMCYTGLGSYCYSWSHPGKLFLEFLAQLDFHYTLGKMLGTKHEEFQKDKTVVNMKRHIISYRQDDCLTADQAREMWDNLLEANEEESEDTFFLIIRDGTFSEHCDDWWDFGVHDYSQESYEFWRLIWKPLMEYLKLEIAEQKRKIAIITEMYESEKYRG